MILTASFTALYRDWKYPYQALYQTSCKTSVYCFKISKICIDKLENSIFAVKWYYEYQETTIFTRLYIFNIYAHSNSICFSNCCFHPIQIKSDPSKYSGKWRRAIWHCKWGNTHLSVLLLLRPRWASSI